MIEYKTVKIDDLEFDDIAPRLQALGTQGWYVIFKFDLKGQTGILLGKETPEELEVLTPKTRKCGNCEHFAATLPGGKGPVAGFCNLLEHTTNSEGTCGEHKWI